MNGSLRPLLEAVGDTLSGERLRMVGGGTTLRRDESICRVTSLLPHEGGPLLYRVRSELESFERVVAESDLSAVP